MIIKAIVSLIALLTGGWMIFDGTHVLKTGKYFGPEKPGPWSDLISSVGVNPFDLGIPFIILGVFWIMFLLGLLLNQSRAWYGAVFTALATLWYLPVGTFLSVLYIILLFIFRNKLLGPQKRSFLRQN